MKKKSTSKNLKIKIAISVAIIMILSFFGGYFTHYLIKGRDASTASWIVSVIENNYCVYDEETGKVKEFTAEDYAEALTTLLDKYSTYYTPEEYSDVISTSKGNNYGVGLAFLTTQTDCEIFKVIGNSPADKAGLKKGDVVKRGTYKNVEQSFSDCEKLLEFLGACEEGQSVTLIVDRKGIEKEFTFKKEVFITSYVTYYDSEISGKFHSQGMKKLELVTAPNEDVTGLASDTAYISLVQFEGGAPEQIEKAMALMKERGRTKLIFDLRDNGGGYMTKLSEISSHFVYGDNGKNCAVAIVKDKKEKFDVYNSTKNLFNEQITEIAVLANENTASASECLIGAMLYYGRAFNKENLIIEKNSDGVAKTYGKGIMQTTFLNIYTGEALKLTTAYVFQPDGKTTIHGKGFTPIASNAVEKGTAISRANELLAN